MRVKNKRYNLRTNLKETPVNKVVTRTCDHHTNCPGWYCKEKSCDFCQTRNQITGSKGETYNYLQNWVFIKRIILSYTPIKVSFSPMKFHRCSCDEHYTPVTDKSDFDWIKTSYLLVLTWSVTRYVKLEPRH